jgi:uncharacterized protein
MTVVEATLWAIGSFLALATLVQAAQKVAPGLQNDIGLFSVCQVVAYLMLLFAIQTIYFPSTRPGVVFGLSAGRWIYYPIAVVLGLSIHLPADSLYEAILARWPDSSTASELLRGFGDLPMWRKAAAGVGLVLLTPLAEESLFRGALFGTLRRRHAAFPVMIATAILFAMIHIEPQKYLPIGVVGAALALLRASSGSMWPGVVMHATFNGVTFYALTQAQRGAEADETLPTSWVVAGTVVTGALLAICDYLRPRKPEEEPKPEEEDEP